ncbi:hypothetical protein F0562_021489 [Nyssa sinensis]|uniref:WRKY transcription factor n=1 Tax=Nyssa sinensis TaxID=561372 RepID=A0A5J5BK02_9ASTE|nr:hypothetical protein F0562_021489 [Nyssa sinensis]
METKEGIKIEDSIRSSPFADHFPASNLAGMLDFEEKSSLGFMELLGIQEFNPSIFDIFQAPIPSKESSALTQTSPVPASSEISNPPMTPNCSSISSESSGAPNHEQTKAVDEEQEQQRTNKQLKPKKLSQKRQREPRFAFMTKSEVDHLEDGYRWRKYGQKAVKNSPFPRSYYRCTNATCNVKKRVERSFNDPSIVVTTYEGKHTHPSPVMPRANAAGLPPGSGCSADGAATFALPVQLTLPHRPQYFNNFSPLNCGYLSSTNPTASIHEGRFYTPTSAFLKDHGLLQDIVPSLMMRKEE